MMPGNQGNTNGDGLYKYNPAIEKIRTSLQKVIAHLNQQNQVLRQKVLTPEKGDRFLTESFRVTEFP
jgi:hypothetical protein